jgi:hypothetical protein
MEDGIGFDLLTTPVTRLRRPLAAMSLKVANIIWSEVKNQGKSKYKRQVNMAPELACQEQLRLLFKIILNDMDHQAAGFIAHGSAAFMQQRSSY